MIKRASKSIAIALVLVMFLSVSAYAFPISNEIKVTFEPNGVIVTNTAELLTALATAKAEDTTDPRTAANPYIILLAGANADAFSGSQFVIDSNYVTIKPYSDTTYSTIKFTGWGANPQTITRSSNRENTPVILVKDVVGVVIDGITVDGAGNIANGNYPVGIGVLDSSASINNVSVLKILHDDVTQVGVQSGTGILVRSMDDANVVNITNSTISGSQKTGILYEGKLTGEISGNTITNHAYTENIAANGLQYGYGSVLNITGNTFTGFYYDGTSSATSCAILYAGEYSGIDTAARMSAHGNTYNDCQYHYLTYGVELYELTVTTTTAVNTDGSYTIAKGDAFIFTPSVTELEVNPEAYTFNAELVIEVVSGTIVYNSVEYDAGDTIVMPIDNLGEITITCNNVLGATINIYVNKPETW